MNKINHFQRFPELYNDPIFPMFYKNAMQAVWLDYTTNYILEQDLNLIDLNSQAQERESVTNADNATDFENPRYQFTI